MLQKVHIIGSHNSPTWSKPQFDSAVGLNDNIVRNNRAFKIMAMYKQYNLPFEIERACRCSFVVRLVNGETAFISNENLWTLMQNPDSQIEIIHHQDNRRGTVQKWIMVAKTEWTLGFKKRIFGPDGRAI